MSGLFLFLFLPGTPEIGGLTSIQGIEILRGCRGMNIVGGDMVEVKYNQYTKIISFKSEVVKHVYPSSLIVHNLSV